MKTLQVVIRTISEKHLWVLASLLITGCAGTFGGGRTLRTVPAAAAATLLVADWCGTRSAAEERWSAGRTETGVPARALMGSTPSTHSVDLYFAGTVVAVFGLEQLIPERYRWVGYTAIAAVEADAVVNNLNTTQCTR